MPATNEIKAKILKEIEGVGTWTIANSGAVPFILGHGVRQWTYGVAQRYPNNNVITIGGTRYIKEGSEVQWAYDEDEYRRSCIKLLSNIGTLKAIYEDFLRDEREFKAFVSKIDEKGESYLIEHYPEFIKAYDNEYISALTIDGILVYGPELVEELKGRYPKSHREIEALIAPYGEVFLGRFRRMLVSLATKNPRGPQLKKELEELRKEFHWMQNNYKNVEKLPLSFFENEFRDERRKGDAILAVEKARLDCAVMEHQKEVEAIRKRNIFNTEDFDKLFWVGVISWWADRRKEYNLIANYYLGRYLRGICEKHGLNYYDTQFLNPWELERVLEGKNRLSDYDIKARKHGSFHFIDSDGDDFFFVGKEASAIWDRIQEMLYKPDFEVIRGSVACKGKVVGIARVVMNPAEAQSFKEGDILVTGMTRPEYMPLMKKAAAFVTDEGGITSHAAIVARELNKPCIVGTKIATRVLKDGMLIEVDADKGEIRVLKDGK